MRRPLGRRYNFLDLIAIRLAHCQFITFYSRNSLGRWALTCYFFCSIRLLNISPTLLLFFDNFHYAIRDCAHTFKQAAFIHLVFFQSH